MIGRRGPGADGPEQSPAQLPATNSSTRPQPHSGVLAARRPNRVPFIAAIALIGLVGLVALYGLYHRAQMNGAFFQRAAADKDQEPASADGVLSIQRPAESVRPVVYHPPPAPAKPVVTKPAQAQEKPAEPDDHGLAAYVQNAWKDYFAARLALDKQRYKLRLAALSAKSAVPGFSATASAHATSAPVEPAQNGVGLGAGGMPGFAAPGMLGYGGMPGDTANQTEKQHFMAQAGDTGQNDVLQATRKPAPGPFAVMAGSYIPAVLETAVNSDSPGAFIARVGGDVYNTATGACVIIPAGSKLIGRYDSQVALGQGRLPGVVTQIIYPDASSVDLGAMEAADQSGAAGFDADVNTHFWQRLGNGLIIGISGIGSSIAQALPFGSAFVGGPAGAINSIANLGLNIPPTLTATPGTRINVITGKDLALRPWSCNGRAPEPRLPIMQIGD